MKEWMKWMKLMMIKARWMIPFLSVLTYHELMLDGTLDPILLKLDWYPKIWHRLALQIKRSHTMNESWTLMMATFFKAQILSCSSRLLPFFFPPYLWYLLPWLCTKHQKAQRFLSLQKVLLIFLDKPFVQNIHEFHDHWLWSDHLRPWSILWKWWWYTRVGLRIWERLTMSLLYRCLAWLAYLLLHLSFFFL